MLKSKMKYTPLFLLMILFPLASAESTFFDNANDAFIMGNPSAQSKTSTGTSQGMTVGRVCTPKWNCTNWSACFSSGNQTRTCTNIGTCSDTYKSPEIEQSCIYTASELKKENKTLKEENEVVDEKEGTKKQNETEKNVVKKETLNKNKIVVNSIILLIIFAIFYLTKNYFRKIINP